jgi:hypothetical protein
MEAEIRGLDADEADVPCADSGGGPSSGRWKPAKLLQIIQRMALAEAIRYAFFALASCLFLDDGHVEIDSEHRGEHRAIIAPLVETGKLGDLDPLARSPC